LRRLARAAIVAATLSVSPAAKGQESTGPPDAVSRWHWAILGGIGHTAQFVTEDETKAFMLLVAPQWSYRLGRVVEAVAEAHFAGYVGNADGWFLGVAPIGFRFQVPDSAWRPYLEFAGGFGWTNLDIIEIDRRFNYIVMGALGARPQGEGGPLSLEVRLVHYSNANTVLPNYSLNSISLVGGWRLR
jgi:hypothetical protein